MTRRGERQSPEARKQYYLQQGFIDASTYSEQALFDLLYEKKVSVVSLNSGRVERYKVAYNRELRTGVFVTSDGGLIRLKNAIENGWMFKVGND